MSQLGPWSTLQNKIFNSYIVGISNTQNVHNIVDDDMDDTFA